MKITTPLIAAIKIYMDKEEISQNQLAQLVGVSQPQIARWLNGTASSMRDSTYKKIQPLIAHELRVHELITILKNEDSIKDLTRIESSAQMDLIHNISHPDCVFYKTNKVLNESSIVSGDLIIAKDVKLLQEQDLIIIELKDSTLLLGLYSYDPNYIYLTANSETQRYRRGEIAAKKKCVGVVRSF
ncbi:hypothetical protein LNTAR_10206 [Lentisphaera araneosa HTCC2155]|uniref:HTH cro/C1-type domain-containing protein n=1 Tax=Lentisphaera araneosa HTCC2155 TaxID=313628 RepID=A6DIJ4_9BACT|nr:helix-turn-helix domain-containing protein [Lentisphaera araneosa]EDM28280.1 hypothetical protein LNTAR_10206 [Lentisphaera araneosa HTCC2155]